MQHLKTRPWGVWLCALLVLSACARSPAPDADPGAVAAAAGIPSLENCALPPDSIRFMIVVDRSGSMAKNWNEWNVVLDQLIVIVDTVPDGAWLRVEAFSHEILIPTPVRDEQVSTSNRDDLRRRVRDDIPFPRGDTDIGRALDTAADVIEQARRPLTFLFVITDGEHDPRPDGKFYPDENVPAFTRLQERWAALSEWPDRQVLPFAIPIGNDGLKGTRLVRRMLGPHTAYANRPIRMEELGGLIAEEIYRARKNLLQVRAEAEAERPYISGRLTEHVQPVGFFGITEAQAVVRPSAHCITYVMNTDGPDATEKHLLMPQAGDSARLIVRLRSQLSWREALPWKEPAAVSFDTDTVLRAWVEFQPSNQLISILVDASPRWVNIPVTGMVEYRPMGWWVVWGSGLLLLLIGGALWWLFAPARCGWLKATKELTRKLDSRQPISKVQGQALSEEGFPLPTVRAGQAVHLVVRRRSRLRGPWSVEMKVLVSGNGDTAEGASHDRLIAAARKPKRERFEIAELPQKKPIVPGTFILWGKTADVPSNGSSIRAQDADSFEGYRWTLRRPN